MSKLNVIKLNDEQLDVLNRSLTSFSACLELMGADELTGDPKMKGKEDVIHGVIALIANANDAK